MGGTGRDLAQEQTKAADGKTNPDQTQARANPSQEGPFRREVHPRISLRSVVRAVHVSIVTKLNPRNEAECT